MMDAAYQARFSLANPSCYQVLYQSCKIYTSSYPRIPGPVRLPTNVRSDSGRSQRSAFTTQRHSAALQMRST